MFGNPGQFAEISLSVLTLLGMGGASLMFFARINQTLGRVAEKLDVLFGGPEVLGSMENMRRDLSEQLAQMRGETDSQTVRLLKSRNFSSKNTRRK